MILYYRLKKVGQLSGGGGGYTDAASMSCIHRCHYEIGMHLKLYTDNPYTERSSKVDVASVL